MIIGSALVGPDQDGAALRVDDIGSACTSRGNGGGPDVTMAKATMSGQPIQNVLVRRSNMGWADGHDHLASCSVVGNEPVYPGL